MNYDAMKNVIAAIVTITTYDEYSAKADYLEALSQACRELDGEEELILFNELMSDVNFCRRLGRIIYGS